MGNCCEHSNLTTDNEAENLIRESIIFTKIYKYDIEEVKKLTKNEIKICIFDIPNDYKKWLTKEAYMKIIDSFITDYDDNQKLLLLDYDYNYGVNFYLSLLMWILAFIRESDSAEKANIVNDIIIKSDNYLSYGTFKKFLDNYIEIILRRITENFINSPEIYKIRSQYDELINKIFSEKNVSEYKDKTFKKFLNYTKKIDHPHLRNDFINVDTLTCFFEKYKLVDILYLRDDFYMQYFTKKNKY